MSSTAQHFKDQTLTQNFGINFLAGPRPLTVSSPLNKHVTDFLALQVLITICLHLSEPEILKTSVYMLIIILPVYANHYIILCSQLIKPTLAL